MSIERFQEKNRDSGLFEISKRMRSRAVYNLTLKIGDKRSERSALSCWLNLKSAATPASASPDFPTFTPAAQPHA